MKFKQSIVVLLLVVLYKSLWKKIELNFLKNSNEEFDFDKSLDMTLIKSELKTLILRLTTKNKKIFYHSTSIIASQMRCFAKKLFDAIEEIKSLIKSINRVTDFDTQLSKRIYLSTSGGGEAEYLQAILELFYQQV